MNSVSVSMFSNTLKLNQQVRSVPKSSHITIIIYVHSIAGTNYLNCHMFIRCLLTFIPKSHPRQNSIKDICIKHKEIIILCDVQIEVY